MSTVEQLKTAFEIFINTTYGEDRDQFSKSQIAEMYQAFLAGAQCGVKIAQDVLPRLCQCENSLCFHKDTPCLNHATTEYVVLDMWTGYLCNVCKQQYEELDYAVEVKA